MARPNVTSLTSTLLHAQELVVIFAYAERHRRQRFLTRDHEDRQHLRADPHWLSPREREVMALGFPPC